MKDLIVVIIMFIVGCILFKKGQFISVILIMLSASYLCVCLLYYMKVSNKIIEIKEQERLNYIEYDWQKINYNSWLIINQRDNEIFDLAIPDEIDELKIIE